MNMIIFLIISCFTFFLPQSVSAHGVGYQVLDTNKAVSVYFYYSTGEAMSYAETLVFSPKDKKVEYQNGRTDQSGRFSFYPDSAGVWNIEVNDGMGHKVQGKIEVDEIESDKMQMNSVTSAKNLIDCSSSSMVLKCVAGLSLILNLYFVLRLYLWKKRNPLKL